MENNYPLLPMQLQLRSAMNSLAACNELSSNYGLTLTGDQMLSLTERRFHALKSTGRVEFGEGILPKLVFAFCDSPFISPDNYEDTLTELQDIFYYFKSEAMESLTDDELIDTMVSIFNGKAQGSLEYLSGTSLENLCRGTRGGTPYDDTDPPLYEEEYD